MPNDCADKFEKYFHKLIKPYMDKMDFMMVKILQDSKDARRDAWFEAWKQKN